MTVSISSAELAFLENTVRDQYLQILTPHLPTGISEEKIIYKQEVLLNEWILSTEIGKYIAWYYTPMALALGQSLPVAALTIYDCMDELSAFKNAPAFIKEKEKMLLQKADLVFTGGYSLYEAKKDLHPDIHPFPSSIAWIH